eukprot:967849-Prymnesium_polylepis.1
MRCASGASREAVARGVRVPFLRLVADSSNLVCGVGGSLQGSTDYLSSWTHTHSSDAGNSDAPSPPRRTHTRMPELAWSRCVRPRTEKPSPSGAGGPRSERSLLVQFHNVKLTTAGGLVDGELWMQNGSIVDPQGRFWQRDGSAALGHDRRIDCKGMILAPGFIDVHVGSAFGVDFTALGAKDGAAATKAAEREIAHVRERLPEYGITAFCPTIRPADAATYRRLRARVRPAADGAAARLVGLHFD